MENIIEFKSVKKSFGHKTILDNLSFQVNSGDFIGLIGNNGCGKTTTIHILCNLLDYDSGEVRVFDKVVTKEYAKYKNHFGIVLSKPYYIEDFSPIEHLSFVAKFQNIRKDHITKRIDEILGFMDLKKHSKELIKNLSSGNQMKISLASALIHSPDILVLDEPFVNLDIKSTENILNILESLKKVKSLFITSHNLDLIANLCDSFLIMDEGKIIHKLYKSDFANVEAVKDHVKDLLADKGKSAHDFSWLTKTKNTN